MIRIEKPELPAIRQCNSCYLKSNVREIIIGNKQCETAIALCENCRKELIEELKRHK